MTAGDDVRALVLYRLQQADEALQAARVLAGEGMPRQGVGRAYYAMFYSVLGLLAHRGLVSSRHSSAISLFDREFVKNGPFARRHSKSLHELFDLRQRADYREMFDLSAERAEEAIASASEFVDDVRTFLDREMGL